MIRRYKKTDLEAVRKIHAKVGYGFKLPNLNTMEISYVVEEGGRVVAFAGAEMEAQIFGIFDPDWGSPHLRHRAICNLHAPVAKQLDLRGVKTANVAVDPKFPKFGKRLSRMGWSEALWRHFFLDVKQAVRALVK